MPKPARPRRGMFAGLKLAADRTEEVPVPAAAPAVTERDRDADRLVRSVGAYARAWSDAERMRQAGLPVLPHQTAALAQADRALETQLPGFGEDLQVALTHAPRLAQGAGTDAGLAALIEAGRVVRAEREKLEVAGARGGAGLGQAGAGVRAGRGEIRSPGAARDRRAHGAVRQGAEAGSPARQPAAATRAADGHRRRLAAGAGGAEPGDRAGADARAGAAA